MSCLLSAQTPGLILKDAGTGAAILDPDGDGYVSQKTNGTQIGFTNPPNSDVSQSKIPYVPIVKIDPINDLEQGRACSFSELVGSASPDQYAALMYWDDAHQAMLFRIRVAYYIANSKDYSVLIDTDQKFGFTGANADPNAKSGNPGFEIEVSLMTNHGVGIYNVDGTTTPVSLAQESFDNYAQKSVAISNFCGDPDYFFDFYVPLSAFASMGVTKDTPLRFAILTNMNPEPCIGSNSWSDVGGTASGNSPDEKLINTINSQTPTSPSNINNGIEDRSVCPPINTVYTNSSSITGTSTEANGTVITVYVYQSDGTTLVGSGTTTVTNNAWTINVSSLSPSVTLATGQIVKATATASGKGTSANDCSTQVITNCTSQTATPLDGEINIISGNKGYDVTINRPIGTKIYLYNTDGTLFDVSLLKAGTTNPMITTAKPQTVSFECKTGQCFVRASGSSVYRFKFEEPGSCMSYEYLSCDYTTGTSSTPTITTSPLTVDSTTIRGRGSSASSEILVYVNDIQYTSVNCGASSPYAFSVNISNLKLGDKISFKQIETGKCYSNPADIYVTRKAYTPIISTPSCNNSYPISSVSGTSVEAAGSTITVYKLPARTVIGTTTVQANGTWTATVSPTISSGDQITAAVTAGTNLTASSDATSVTFSTKTNISNYTITMNTPHEGQTSVSGTISGGSYPVSVRIYIDGTYMAASTVNAAGNWTVSGINSYDLAIGSTINARVVYGSGCESANSSTEAVVLCNAPNTVTITASTHSFCDGTYGEIIVQNSQLGVYYVPVLASDSSVFGYGKMGNGGSLNLTLTTYQITSPVNVSIMASRVPVGGCETFVANNILFSPSLRPVAPLASTTQNFCGTQTLANLVVNVPSGTTLKWYNASSGGSELPSSTVLVNGNIYYAEAVCDSNYCTSTNRTPITTNEGNPAPPVASAAQIKCTESYLTNLTANHTGPGTVVWYSDASGGSPLPMNTPLVTGTTYYAETVNGTCSSTTRTAVSVTLGMVPDTTYWTGAVSNDWTDDANWNTKHPTICSHVVIPDVGNGVAYPIITGPAACQSITFLPGGAVLGLQHLSYTQAYVHLKVRRNKWYTLTAPLKSIFSGDYYLNASPKTLMRLFNDVNPDEEGTTTAVGEWTSSFSNLTVPLLPGRAFGFFVDTLSFHYPNPSTIDHSDTTICFPKQNADKSLVRVVVPHSELNGKPYPVLTQYMPKDSTVAFRFAMENASNQLVNVSVPIKKGLNLVGNPMMAHLDFSKLYASNSGKISNKVKFWNGSTFNSFIAGDNISSDMDLTNTSIPPMQSFFVEALNDSDNLYIDLDNHFIADETTKLRSTKAEKKILYIKSSLGKYNSSASIALNEKANNGYSNDDAFKLFTQIQAVPEVYTLADNKTVDINQFSSLPYLVPVGIKTASKGNIKLQFAGADNFEGIDVTLMNTLTGEQQNLKADNVYNLNFDGTQTDGSLFVEFRSANTVTETPESNTCGVNRCIQVFARDKNQIYAISPENEQIKRVTVWESDGKQIYNNINVNTSNFEARMETSCHVCMVRVQTVKRTYLIKLLME